MKKSGMSGIIVTLILIAVALAVVGIVWFVINNVVQTQVSEIENSSSSFFGSCSAAGYPKMFEGDLCNSTTSYVGGEKCCEGFSFQATTGLVSYWSFNIDASDDYGNYDGTVYGATWNSTGGFNGKGAYEFDEVNDYIQLSNIINSTNLTILFWAKLNEEDYQGIVGFDTASNSYLRFGQAVGQWNQNIAGSVYGELVSLDFTNPDNISSGEFNYFTIVKNSEVDWKLYINGIYQSSDSDASQNLVINRIGKVRSGDNLNGTIDEVRIYNRVFNESEIKFLYELD